MIFLLLFSYCIQMDRAVDGFGKISDFKINNNYLYLLTSTNLWIFDISNPENPVTYKEIQILNQGLGLEIWDDLIFLSIYDKGLYCFTLDSINNFMPISLIGDLCNVTDMVFEYPYLYIVDPEKGFFIYNYSNPYNPQLISKIKIPNSFKIKLHNDFAFIYNSSPQILIFDVRDPLSPVFLSHIMPVYLNDFDLKNEILYGISDKCIYMADITNPQNPVGMGHLCYDEIGIGKRIKISFPYAIILGYSNILFFDITDKWNPKICGYSVPINQHCEFILNGNYIYIAGSSGVEVLKFEDFHSPIPIFSFEKKFSYTVEMETENNFLFRFFSPDFEIWDLSNIFSPILIKTLRNQFWLTFAHKGNTVYFGLDDKIEIWDFANPNNPLKINEFHTYLNRTKKLYTFDKYLICISSSYFSIYDVANPMSPVEVSFNYHQGAPNCSSFKWPYLAIGYSKLTIWDLNDLTAPSIIFEEQFNDYFRDIEFYDGYKILLSFENKLILYDFNERIALSENDLTYAGNLFVYQNYIFNDCFYGSCIFKEEENNLKLISYYPDGGPVSGTYPYFIFENTIGDFKDIESPIKVGKYERTKEYLDVINDGDSFYIISEDGLYWWRYNFPEPKKMLNFSWHWYSFANFLSAKDGKIFFNYNYSLCLLDNRNPLDPWFFNLSSWKMIEHLKLINENYAFALDKIYQDPFKYYYELNLLDFSNFEDVNFKFLKNYNSNKICIDNNEKFVAIGYGDKLDIWNVEDPLNPNEIVTLQFDKYVFDVKFLGKYLAILFSGRISIYDLKNPSEPCILSSIENIFSNNKLFYMPFILGLYNTEGEVEFWSLEDIRNPFKLDSLKFWYGQKIGKVLPFNLRFGLFIQPTQISIWDLCNCVNLNVKCFPYSEPINFNH